MKNQGPVLGGGGMVGTGGRGGRSDWCGAWVCENKKCGANGAANGSLCEIVAYTLVVQVGLFKQKNTKYLRPKESIRGCFVDRAPVCRNKAKYPGRRRKHEEKVGPFNKMVKQS